VALHILQCTNFRLSLATFATFFLTLIAEFAGNLELQRISARAPYRV